MLDVRVQEIGRGQLDAAALAKLERAIRLSSFVAIDTEMGGVLYHDSPRPSFMDSIDERYAQYLNSSQHFPLVQFGLSIFHWDATARAFDVQTFQFPLFPVVHDKDLGYSNCALACPDRRFLVQAKCLQYIRAHGFDLNAWIDQGIGHLSHYEQQQEPCKSALQQLARPKILEKFDVALPALITDEMQGFLDESMTTLKAAFHDGAVGQSTGLQDCKLRRKRCHGGKKSKTKHHGDTKRRKKETLLCTTGKEEFGDGTNKTNGKKERGEDREESGQHGLTTTMAHAETDADIIAGMKQFLMAPVSDDATNGPCLAYVTEPLAPFRRHALVQYLRQVLPDTVALDCQVDNLDHDNVVQSPWRRRVRIIATRCKSERRALVVADQQLADDERRERHQSLIGFTAVLDVIVAAQKPIVGHNMLLDLMQCYEKFHEPLPGCCAEFQSRLHAWIGAGGGVFDTKTLVDYAIQTVDSFATHLTHTALENCFNVLSKHPFYGPDVQNVQGEDIVRNPSASSHTPLQAHQAGYDAFMTGFVFLRACSGLGVSNECMADLSTTRTEHTDDALQRLRNVLYVSHFLPAYVLKLPGPYPQPTPTPSRSRFVRMKLTRTRAPTALAATLLPGSTVCPAVKTFHIKHCVGWVLNLPSASRLVHVHWEGQDCVYVELPSAEAAEQLLAIRAQTKECWGSTNDPMPSIGCVDMDRCFATPATDLAPSQSAQPSTSDDEQSRRTRKGCEMAKQ